MNFLPDKKIISFSIIVFGLVLGIMFSFRKQETQKIVNISNNLVVGDKVNLPNNTDWQIELEKIPNTDIEPIDKEEKNKKTLTDKISEDFMSSYLTLKQNGQYNDTNAQILVDKTLDYISKTESEQNIGDIKLNIFADRGKSSIIEYGERLGNIMKKNKPKDAKNEIKILESVATSKDEKQIEDLKQISSKYAQIAKDLVDMPIPQSFKKAHLDLIVSMKGFESATAEMAFVLNDPFRAITAIQKYQENTVIFSEVMKAIIKHIITNKISYKQGSGGYYLLYGI